MTNSAKLINAAKDDPTILTQLIYKGKQLANYNVDDLKIDVLPSGFPSFDKMLLFKKNRGELIFIGARPSAGKSSLLFQLATNMARKGRVMVTSLEDSHEAIATRQTAAVLNKSIDVIQHGAIDRKELLDAQEFLANLNFVIDDEGGLNVFQICERARMQHSKEALVAVFIDYIQIIKSERKNSRAEDVAAISSELKALAKELKLPVIVASQLNRNADQRESKKPQLSDFKESGAIEQDADVALLIHREGADAEIIVAKNKNGPTGSVLMQYKAPQCRFIDKQVGGNAHALE